MKLTPFKLLVLAVLVGVGWTFRGEFDGQFAKVRDVRTRFATWMDMKEYAEGMRTYLRDRETPRDFGAWIERRFPDQVEDGVERRSSMDRYGKPYLLEVDRNGKMVIRSCGVDTVCKSDDDIEVEVKVEG